MERQQVNAYTTRARVNALAEFAQNALAGLRLKAPNDRDINAVEYAAPHVHAVYLPPTNPRRAGLDAPSVTISPALIENDPSGAGHMTVRAVALAWDVGTRPVTPDTDASAGWESALLIIDTLINALNSTPDIAGMRVKPGARLGLYTDGHHDPLDARPYYMAWLEFDVVYSYAFPARSFGKYLD